MNHTAILRRAWHITWRYRILWIFGLFMAPLAGSGGSGGGGRASSDASSWPWGSVPSFTEKELASIVAVAAGLIVVAVAVSLLLALVSTVLRYLAETAVIRAVDDYETTGEKRSFGSVFHLGWSWRAVRLFLIDLVVCIPAVVLFVALALIALSPLVLWAFESEVLGIAGTVLTIGFFGLLAILAIAAAVVWAVLQPFIWRAAVLDDCGVFASISRGYAIVRARLRDAGIMWLLLVVLQFLFGITALVVFLIVAVLGLLVGGLLGYAVYALSSLAFYASTPVILGVVVGLPVALLVIALPMAVISTLIAVFKSSVWTLTFRELSPSVARA